MLMKKWMNKIGKKKRNETMKRKKCKNKKKENEEIFKWRIFGFILFLFLIFIIAIERQKKIEHFFAANWVVIQMFYLEKKLKGIHYSILSMIILITSTNAFVKMYIWEAFV